MTRETFELAGTGVHKLRAGQVIIATEYRPDGTLTVTVEQPRTTAERLAERDRFLAASSI